MIRLGIAAAAGYFAARALLDHEVPEQCPAPLRGPLLTAQAQLREWRSLAREALDAGRRERDAAERDLHDDYLGRTHRR
ncbi:MAG: hypothetical protein WC211_09610 [Dehalococcoidia bacterium]